MQWCKKVTAFVCCRNLLDAEELDKLREDTESNEDILGHSFGADDNKGRSSVLSLWNHPGDDITGMLARSQKVAGTAEKVNIMFMTCRG